MYKDQQIQVILPALNESGKIQRTIARVPRPLVDHVVVVDDGSTDSTATEAAAAGAVVLRHEHNRGVGAAIRTGIEHGLAAGIPLTAIMASDDQDYPEELERFCEAVVDQSFDFVQGSRYLPGGQRLNQPFSRTLMTRSYSIVYSICVRRHITDATNGFKLFRTEVCRQMDIGQDWLDRYELEPYILWMAIKKGFKVTEVPVTKYYPQDRSVGYTKMKFYRDWWRISRPILLLTLGIRH
jgi:dolichol-phosphate mannosyltransferase